MTVSKELYTFAPIPATTAAHFSSLPWCQAILSDPTLRPFEARQRILKPHTGDTLTSIALNTAETIKELQQLYSPPSSTRPFGEILQLISLGSHVNGHIDTCHGGFVGVMLDDMIGCAAESARPRDKTTMTAYLNITYKKPIRTPSIVLGKSWIERKEGRKLFGKATIEDGNGTILATGDALFIILKEVKPMAKL
ncbi:Thioesterase superfamily protein [Rutstroemia sp. NJR-2017a BVV2]|nr:Thioesterase superfamily protein [Rutstroemia sp. NJR-2017a BVV2]